MIVVALVVLPSMFGLSSLPLTCLLFVFTVVLASYFVVTIVMNIINKAGLLTLTQDSAEKRKTAVESKQRS